MSARELSRRAAESAPSPREVTPQGDAEGQVLMLHDIRKVFGGVTALDGVSFDLRRGEVHALLGENGAGKSTLIKVIAGAYTPDAGAIKIGGAWRPNLTPDQARALGIAVVYQEFNLLPDLTVAENIFLGHQPRGRFGLVNLRARRRDAAQILERLGAHLDPDRLVRFLTVGEQQIVEIAKALAIDAHILILDEPSAVLPASDVERLFTVVRTLRASDTSLIYISHRLEEIFEIADRVTVLKDGKSVCTKSVSETSRGELIRLMVGRPLSEQFPDRTPHSGEAVLEIRDLAVEGCVWDVTFTLHRGEILGLAGLGGSGRTTICRALVGLADVDSGEIRLEGRRAPRNPAAAAKQGLVLVPEDRKAHGLVMGQSVGFNITLPWLESIARLRVLLAGQEESPLVEQTIKRFQVRPPSRDLPVENLSGGNQQKVVLGKWLLTNPKVVVLDEPTRGIDVGAKAEIYSIMKQLSQQGVGIIVASSELPELLGTCDRILVLHEGRIRGEFLRGEFSEEAILHCAIGAVSEDEPEGGEDG